MKNKISLIIYFLFIINFYSNSQINTEIIKKFAPILHFHPNEGYQCCYPSDAEQAYNLIKVGNFSEIKKPNNIDDFKKNIPYCYYQYWEGKIKKINFIRIKYWIWYNFNDFPEGELMEFLGSCFGSHEGDWESIEAIVVINLQKEKNIFCYILSNHEKLITIYPSDKDIILKNNRIVVLVAKGSHANYPISNYPHIVMKIPVPTKKNDIIIEDIVPDEKDNGFEWDTQSYLKNINETNFAKDNYLGKFGSHDYTVDLIFKKWIFDPPKSPLLRQFENEIVKFVGF